jgi:hypothetical protein
VTVLLDGRPIDASAPAILSHGTVVAPLDPFVRGLAGQIDFDPAGGTIRIVRDGFTAELAIGDRALRGDPRRATLPIAPFLRDGQPQIPLAAVARALGASVNYDARSRTLEIALPPPVELTSPPPAVVPAAQPRATFTPQPVVTPRPSVTGIPQPRRTPIWEQPSQPVFRSPESTGRP